MANGRFMAGLLMLIMVAVDISGCATAGEGLATEGRGWRMGWVNRIAEGKDLRNIEERECVAPLAPDQIMHSRFAVVWYAKGRGRQARTVLIPDSSDLKVGDEVRINVLDCAAPLVRVTE